MADSYISSRISELESERCSLQEKNARLSLALGKARDQLLSMQEKLTEMTRPPASLGVTVKVFPVEREIEVVLAGRPLRLAVDTDLDLKDLTPGRQVRVSENMVVTAIDRFGNRGEVVPVIEVVDSERILVGSTGQSEHLLSLAAPLRHGRIRAGDSVLADLRAGFALEKITRSRVEQLLTPELPDVSYGDIGGLDAQIGMVRDAVELPFSHPELYRRYGLRAPKGILLYGPPGCGKTLIAKAIATALARSRGDAPYFLSIKGPELLNKFVGETERQIRSIFSRARMLASRNVPVVVFFDEMEALFRVRGSGISSDVETMIVPQLLAEIDGVERLDNVIVIGASNREDMIDPAVLRPGRLDIKIRIERPDEAGARDILSKYLTPAVPLHISEITAHGSVNGALTALTAQLAAAFFAHSPENALFEVSLQSGRVITGYLGDIISGALIAGVVDRAKKLAIKDLISTGEEGLRFEHLAEALRQEARESADVVAANSPEDWAVIVGHRGERVVGLRPISSGEE